jgi:hypothetical protein
MRPDVAAFFDESTFTVSYVVSDPRSKKPSSSPARWFQRSRSTRAMSLNQHIATTTRTWMQTR